MSKEVGVIVVAHLPRLTCLPWLPSCGYGEGTFQERIPLATLSQISSLQSAINLRGGVFEDSRHKGEKGDIKSVRNGHGSRNDRCSKPTMADMPVARRRSIARTGQTSRGISYTFVPDESSLLSGKCWWEQRWE